MKNFILADGRWSGVNGIGRFSSEILARLSGTDIFSNGPTPLSLKSLIWLPYFLKQKKHYHVFLNTGFNPVLYSDLPYVIVIYDLIHLFAPGKAKWFKKIYYELLIKPTIRKAKKILTISEYSKKTIANWAGISEEKIQVVSCGLSSEFKADGPKHDAGSPYLLHVGNTKAHKNILRLLESFAHAKINPNIKLIFTGEKTSKITKKINQLNLADRLIFAGALTANQLAEFYRGAVGVVFPSLYEGFGLPVLEGMACGVPVLTSNATSLPEVAGNAAILIDPMNIESMASGIEKLVNDSDLRKELINCGFEQVKLFSWDKTAEKVQEVLNNLIPPTPNLPPPKAWKKGDTMIKISNNFQPSNLRHDDQNQ